MTAADRPAILHIERPGGPAALLPYMGHVITALPDRAPPWTGQLIALGECAHIRDLTGVIREFPLPETVFAVQRLNK